MAELQVRLGCSRRLIYKLAQTSRLELVKNAGKTGALDSAVRAYLAALPKAVITQAGSGKV